MSYLSTVNTRAILPMARILLRITSFLLIASLCSSSSSPSSSSSVQILRIFTSISVTNSKGVKNKSWMEESNSWCLYCEFLELSHLKENLAIECWEGWQPLFIWEHYCSRIKCTMIISTTNFYIYKKQLPLSDWLVLIQNFEHFKWFHANVTRKRFYAKLLQYSLNIDYHPLAKQDYRLSRPLLSSETRLLELLVRFIVK